MADSGLDEHIRRAGLLLDTNLLVLYLVGMVNPRRIEQHKRTRAYRLSDFLILADIVEAARTLYTLPHVLAETSNLTVLMGREEAVARELLHEFITMVEEYPITSREAATHRAYGRLGLTDAAVVTTVGRIGCALLTADLKLYVTCLEEGLGAWNFTHLRGL